MIMDDMYDKFRNTTTGNDEPFTEELLIEAIDGTAPLLMSLIGSMQDTINEAHAGGVTGKPVQLIGGEQFVSDKEVTLTAEQVEAALMVNAYNRAVDFERHELIGFAMTALSLLVRLVPMPQELMEDKVEDVLTALHPALDKAVEMLATSIKVDGVSQAILPLHAAISEPEQTASTGMLAIAALHRLAMHKLLMDALDD